MAEKKQITEDKGINRDNGRMESISHPAFAPESVLNIFDDVIVKIDPNGKIITINNAVRQYGYEPVDLVGRSIFDIMKSLYSCREEALLNIKKSRYKDSQSTELRFKSGEGGIRYFESKQFETSERNIYAVNREITERRIAEQKLKESEDKYRNLFENALVAIFRTRIADGKILSANDAGAKLLGFRNTESILRSGITMKDLHLDQDREDLMKLLKDNGEIRGYETRYILPNGEIKDVSLSLKIFPDKGIIEGFVIDDTRRKESERKLRLSEEKYRELVENANSIILRMDVDGNVTFFNEYAQNFFGYSLKEIIGRNVLDTIVPLNEEKTGKNLFEFVEEFLIDPVKYENMENENVKKNGERVWIAWTNKIIYNEDNKIVGFLCVGNDQTERKNAERELYSTQKKLEAIVNNAFQFTGLLSPEGSLLMANQTAIDFIGKPLEEIQGKPFWETPWWDVSDDVKNRIKNAVMRARAGDHVQFETVHQDKQNKLQNIKFSLRPIINEEGKIIYLVPEGRVITEEKKTEEENRKLERQLFHAQKMESIGRLAGGIAHDFNNILTSILGYAHLLGMKFNEEGSIENNAVGIIVDCVERASKLTKQLLGFAKGGEFNPTPLDLNKAINRVLKISDKIFDKKVKIKKEFQKIPYVYADCSQIDQVITNIIINARDAMPSGGDLTAKTELINFDGNGKTGLMNLDPGDYVRMSFTDTGTGMSNEVKEKIFEPFYTTKGEGKGTGLGLATTYGIIKNHKGEITVISKPGEGTTFNFYLPVTEELPKTKIPLPDVSGSNETILIIDDEEKIRYVLGKQLESRGYKVLEAKSGKMGLELYKDNMKSIGLVLIDMIMPGIDGNETYKELKELNPDVKAVLISGYSAEERAEEAIDSGINGFLQKPFSLRDLTKTISDVIHK